MRNFPDRALITWAVWSMVVYCAAITALTGSPITTNPLREPAERLATITANQPLFWLGPDEPDARFIVYVGRAVPRVQAVQVIQAVTERKPFFVLTPESAPSVHPALVSEIVFPGTDFRLWHFEPAP